MGRYHPTENTNSNYLLIAILTVLVIAGLFYFSQQQKPTDQIKEVLELPAEQSAPLVVNPVMLSKNDAQENKQEPSAQGQTEVYTDQIIKETILLPSLAESDERFKKDLTGLSGNLNDWLTTDQLITKYLKVINDASQGQRLYQHMRFLAPDKAFTTKQDEQGLYIDPLSYRRYDRLTAAINALDVQESLEFYKKYRPLYQQVFTAFGYPEQYHIEDIFKKTAAVILEAPIIEGRIRLIHPTVRYKFSDKKLEELDPLQKQMIRMGPINTRVIQYKVRLLVEALVNEENL